MSVFYQKGFCGHFQECDMEEYGCCGYGPMDCLEECDLCKNKFCLRCAITVEDKKTATFCRNCVRDHMKKVANKIGKKSN